MFYKAGVLSQLMAFQTNILHKHCQWPVYIMTHSHQTTQFTISLMNNCSFYDMTTFSTIFVTSIYHSIIFDIEFLPHDALSYLRKLYTHASTLLQSCMRGAVQQKSGQAWFDLKW